MSVRPRSAGATRRPSRTSGQATVEVALAFPVVAIMLLALVQITLVVRDQVATVHAAREGARAGAVAGAGPGDAVAAARAATALDPGRLSVQVGSGPVVGSPFATDPRPTYRSSGALIGDVTVQATATMRAEP